ncbi:protein kinase [Streptomyces sp. NPDC005438]|uniref:serine/threonine-protein kinase n=1 Tax=Streptomyces sp. NPDC005438 TaxID=3156880 RepID=UPI0033A80EFA
MRPVGSKYFLEEPLGRGATGTVWRARQGAPPGESTPEGVPAGEPVAIKVLKEELAHDPDVVMRFLQERSVLLRLTHPNIVRTRDLVVEGDLLALVMDLIDGPDLHRYLRENGPLSAVAAALLTAQVADALAASHADGIVHRDLKPANVLLAGVSDQSGAMRPMLTDFGIARLADSPGLTRADQFVGTPAYVAPESAEGRPQTSAVDIYGAGILLYEVITGNPPFTGDSSLQVLQRHLSEPPPRPQGVPEPLWTVIERCLSKDPEQRPSAVNLARALRTVAGGVGARATAQQAAAAMGVAAMLAPDPAPTSVPDSESTQALPHGSGNPDAEPTRAMPRTGATDPDATSVLPQGSGSGTPNPPGDDANATRVMPPVPGEPPQQAGPHPWASQMSAARDRNEQTQVQPVDPQLDPLRRRPQRQRPQQQQRPRQQQQQYQQSYPQQYGQRPVQHYEPQPSPPQQPRYEPRPQRPQREPRQPRQRSANPTRIPGLGCLKGCLVMILLVVVILVLVWNFTPVPEWLDQSKSLWDTTTDWLSEAKKWMEELGSASE